MTQPLGILLAPDSFKGSLSAVQFCQIAEQAIRLSHPDARILSRPLSDGGEGFVEGFVAAGLAEAKTLWVGNALGRKTKAQFAWLADEQTAIIEMAQACGLPKIRPEERNPMHTHTYGAGQLIQAAIDLGARKVILGLGGSATNDGGSGALQALGVELLDRQGKPIGLGGQSLRDLASIGPIPAHLLEIEWELACDVTNPLLGETGATRVFGPQKGVTEHTLPVLEAGLANWAQRLFETRGVQVADLPGSGAAGGMAAGFMGLLNARMTPGFDVLNRHLQLNTLLETTPIDWIVTGEGRIDTQTRFGKLPLRIAQLGLDHKVPTIGVCGSLLCSLEELPEFHALFSILNAPKHEIDAMQSAPQMLYDTLASIFRLIR
jgi:glycerate kinase